MDPTQVAAQAAARKVKRAEGLLRDAVRDLTSLAGDGDVFDVVRAHDRSSTRAALELIEVGVGRHGAVDVLVIARPTGRPQHHPHHGPRERAKETNDGTRDHRRQEDAGSA
jgi:hypothetical protein